MVVGARPCHQPLLGVAVRKGRPSQLLNMGASDSKLTFRQNFYKLQVRPFDRALPAILLIALLRRTLQRCPTMRAFGILSWSFRRECRMFSV